MGISELEGLMHTRSRRSATLVQAASSVKTVADRKRGKPRPAATGQPQPEPWFSPVFIAAIVLPFQADGRSNSLPRTAFLAVLCKAAKQAISSNRLLWDSGTLRFQPAINQPPHIVDKTGSMFIAAQVDKAQICRHAKQETQLLQPRFTCRK